MAKEKDDKTKEEEVHLKSDFTKTAYHTFVEHTFETRANEFGAISVQAATNFLHVAALNFCTTRNNEYFAAHYTINLAN
jgi:hypothetical protein